MADRSNRRIDLRLRAWLAREVARRTCGSVRRFEETHEIRRRVQRLQAQQALPVCNVEVALCALLDARQHVPLANVSVDQARAACEGFSSRGCFGRGSPDPAASWTASLHSRASGCRRPLRLLLSLPTSGRSRRQVRAGLPERRCRATRKQPRSLLRRRAEGRPRSGAAPRLLRTRHQYQPAEEPKLRPSQRRSSKPKVSLVRPSNVFAHQPRAPLRRPSAA